MGIQEGAGGGGSLAIGTECIKSGFELAESGGDVVWVSSVSHAYVLKDGQVFNNHDVGFNYPLLSHAQIELMILNRQAIILTSVETAPKEITSHIR